MRKMLGQKKPKIAAKNQAKYCVSPLLLLQWQFTFAIYAFSDKFVFSRCKIFNFEATTYLDLLLS